MNHQEGKHQSGKIVPQDIPWSVDQMNREPQTHVKNKSIQETLFGSCIDNEFELTRPEIQQWWELRIELLPLYDDEDPNCVKRVKGLWYILTDKELPDDQIKNEKWTYFGFQQQNPTTDFRGGGIKSLEDIINFASNNKDYVCNVMCDPKNDFYFAASSINVTFFMKKYFHLLNSLHVEKDKQEYCPRIALKNFCNFLVKEENLWAQLHELLLRDLFANCWLKLKQNNPNITILNYGQAVDHMQRKLKQAMSHRLFVDYQQFAWFYKALN